MNGLCSETTENAFSVVYALEQAQAFGGFLNIISTSVFKIVAFLKLNLKHLIEQIGLRNS
jgi:hypothetical protein